MKLKAIVDSLDNVDEKYHDLYEERDGKFHLVQIDGLVSDADVSRVKRALEQEKNSHKETKTKLKAIDGVDLDTLSEDLAELEAFRANGKPEEAKVALAEAKRNAAALQRKVEDLTRENCELSASNGKLTADADGRNLDDSVRTALGKIQGIVPTAIGDALVLARAALTKGDDGEFADANGASVSDWVRTATEQRPHWFAGSAGGGAGAGRAGSRAPNPFSAENWSITEQAKLRTANITEYTRMAKAAGVNPEMPVRPAAK